MHPLILAVAIAAPLVLLAGPLALGAASTQTLRDWRTVAASAVTYALAFNLIFLIQELGLVVPKALTPGLEPTLFHNNHDWRGHHPLENLFQGTGALATMAVAALAAAWLAWRPPSGPAMRLFAIWMMYHGLVMALAQGVVGAVLPANDVGRAMDFFGLPPAGKAIVAAISVIGLILAARWTCRHMRALSGDGPAGRAVFRTAVLPAALGLLLVVPFRAPGNFEQVVLVPVAVALVGVPWVQAWAWRAAPAPVPAPTGAPGLIPALLALLVLLAIFQGVLRPGVGF